MVEHISNCSSCDLVGSDVSKGTSEIKYGIRTPEKLNPYSKNGRTTYSLMEAYNSYRRKLEEPKTQSKMIRKTKIQKKLEQKLSELKRYTAADKPLTVGSPFPKNIESPSDYSQISNPFQIIGMELRFAEFVDKIFDHGSYAVLGERTINETVKKKYYPNDYGYGNRVKYLINPDSQREEFIIPVSHPITDVIEIRLSKENIRGSLQIASDMESKRMYENLQVFKVGTIGEKPYISKYQYVIEMGAGTIKCDMMFGQKERLHPSQNKGFDDVFKFLDSELNLTS